MPTASGHTTAIRASRVVGTSVYNIQGEKIGEVEDIVLDKNSSRIMFGVLGFGGFLGIGEKFHPVPWSMLDYNEDKSGYIVPLTREQIESAPAHSLDELTRGDGMKIRQASYHYYKANPDW